MKKKTKNKAIRYFFLISVGFHAVLLVYLGRSILERRCERRIEVDLKSLASGKSFRSIPQPYKRSQIVPQTKPIKTTVKSLTPKPIPLPVPVRALEPEKTFSAQVTEKIYAPLPESASTFLSQAQADTGAQASLGVVGQIKAIEMPHLPTKIKAASDTFDQILAYQGNLRQHIEEYKRFPPLAVKRGWEGRVSLRFLLQRNGQVKQIEVTKSSRYSLLDEAAISAVRASSPFPPFPESISQDTMMIEVTLNFELQRRTS